MKPLIQFHSNLFPEDDGPYPRIVPQRPELSVSSKLFLRAHEVGDTVSLKVENAVKVWEFPKERFVTYEASDERWARPLGFGREVERIERIEIPRAIVTGVEPGRLTLQPIDIEPVMYA